jgi:hypothetical protein
MKEAARERESGNEKNESTRRIMMNESGQCMFAGKEIEGVLKQTSTSDIRSDEMIVRAFLSFFFFLV